jgi:organic radical activating enzyme
MSTKISNGSFCVLPFIERFQNLNGKNYLCCESTVPIDSVESTESSALRTKIYHGEKISHCENCYALEKNNTISPRQRESIQWLKDVEVKNYIDNWKPEEKLKTFYYDIRFDNKCNLACISCNPKASSLWAKELKINVDKYPLNFDIEQCFNAKKIYLAGGEPLIIDSFIDLISKIAESDYQPELVINTNLTKVNDKLKTLLSKIRNLCLTVSVDAYDKVNEYHRWPMAWPKFLNNLKWASEIGCTIRFNSVVDAVTVLNIHQLQELEHYTHQWSLSILSAPMELQIKNLPVFVKSQVLANFSNIEKSRFYQTDPIFKSSVENIKTQIMQHGDHALLSKYLSDIDHRRGINHINYLGIKLT